GAGVDDASGSLFSAGASTVTYTATDMGGNPASCSFTVTVACSASSDNCCLEWASQVGANSNYWSGFATTADATGNPVIVGTSSTSGASLLFNLFVSRFAPSGALLWTVDIPGFTELELHGVKTDALGNIYVAGGFSGTADFDPGSNVYTLTSTGSRDGFILKLDPSGAFLWAFQLTGVGINLFPELDPSGDLLIAGYTQGSTIDFDPGPGVAPLVFSSLDCFVARYTPSGALVWAKKLSDGTPGSSAFLTAFHADQSGNLYLAGRFSGTVDFDPGPGTYNLTGSAGGDLFVTKLDASGNFLWTDAFPNLTSTFSTITLVSSIAVDVQGSVFLACLFDGGPFDMDPGPGSVILTPIGVLDIVVTKLSSTGAHFWSKQVGAAGATIWVRSAAVDAQGNVYSAGFANGTVDFDPGSGVSLFSSNPGNATFIQKLDNGGNFVWVKQIAQSRSEGVFVDNSGSIFCTGSFIGTTDFDPGPGSYNLTANAANDAYLLKLGTCVPADTCICGAFSDMFIRGPQGAMSRPVLCGGPPLNIGCPAPGVGFTLTGSFMCAGDSCTSSADLDWSLYGPDNNLIASDTASADPWFGFNLPSSVFSQSGVYTLIISGHCGADSCTCNIQFMVEEGCMETCPCDLADLNSDVNQGFATAYAANSCKVCFTPLALSDCDEVEWFVDDPLGTAVGTSTGNQTFCHTFPTGGTYTVYMTVTRKRADGSLCESSAKNQIVTVTCLTRTVCENSLLPNPDFEEGAVAGSLGMEGMSAGWTRVWGDPHINVNGGKKKVRLTGNFDNADVLSTQEAICLQKTTGTISLRCGIKEQGLRSTLNIQFFTGDDYTFGACSSENCFLVARIELPPSDTSEEFDVVIPYDISTWAPAELCGNGSGVMIRPAIFVTNDLGDEQGEDTRTVIDLDYFCLDGMLVGLNGPGKPRSMRLYPNPSAGSFTLELAQAASPATTIRIIGLTGQVVAERRAEIGRMQQRVEAGNLPAGLYFVHLAVEGRTVGVLKWVKQ
ncbi:MAG TPA: SBBP repeat-containing protein, partial [Flavilitoribacter sp.]|nr:SBBP repeat-containing protein [Flavilitoribacter sp.]